MTANLQENQTAPLTKITSSDTASSFTATTMNSNATRAPVSRKNSDCPDEVATDMIKEGLTDAFRREKAKKQELSQVPIQQRKDMITENFPNVQGEKLITAMSETDLMALRLEAYYSEKRRMKEMFKKVQEQISEYHELLEYSNQMESRLETLRQRARFLEEECKEKTLKVSELESEVINLKLNLATEKSSTDRISNELARVKSENQVLVKTLSMQSLQSSCSTTAAATRRRSSSSRAARSGSFRKIATNLSLEMDNSSNHHNAFGLIRPQHKQNRRVSPLPLSDDFFEEEQQQHSGSVGGIMNRTVSWMNGRYHAKRGSNSSLSMDVPNTESPSYSDKADDSCCGAKSTVTAATAQTEISTVSMISNSVTTTAAMMNDSCSNNGFKNADWNVIQPMNASSNPLLMQLKKETSNNLDD